MSTIKFNKNYDVFHACLVENAGCCGLRGLPCIKTGDKIPDCVIPFEKPGRQVTA